MAMTIKEPAVDIERIALKRKFSFAVPFVTVTVADIPELRLTANYCSGMSYTCKGRACKLKYARQAGVQGSNIHQFGPNNCAKAETSRGNLPSGSTLGIQNGKKEISKKRCAEEMKSIRTIYDEAAAASTESSTSGNFSPFRLVRSAMYNQQK
ncbi:hypothetical protein T12_1686 [Trichinella patagoniensis]|uniref:FLYWCH-type domain-containing protein n=1 Tax=Trichinella patagoniensis TaxID=990121 RepID=A0A0V0ZLD7_9BILA|nr:hypothetical protein T12_1686 [Trichinella patagoniensis]